MCRRVSWVVVLASVVLADGELAVGRESAEPRFGLTEPWKLEGAPTMVAVDARPYLARAARTRTAATSAAVWEMALLDGCGAAAVPERQGAELILARYPETQLAVAALEFLASQPSPPKTLIAKAVEAHASAHRGQADKLDRLVWLSLRAGVPEAAEVVTVMLQAVHGGSALEDLYAAELHNARGEANAALVRLQGARLGRRAYEPVLREIEARVREGRRAPPRQPLLATLQEAGNAVIGRAHREAALERSQKMRLEEEISGSCARQLAGRRSLRVYVLSPNSHSAARFQLLDTLPPPAAACVGRILDRMAPFYRWSHSLTLDLGPIDWLQATNRAARQASGTCFTEADLDGLVEGAFELVVRAVGNKTEVDLPPSLRADAAACVRRHFSSVAAPPRATRAMQIAPEVLSPPRD
jgi:hypothetical protein